MKFCCYGGGKCHTQLFDAVIIVTSFTLDLIFVEGITGVQGEETLALIIIFLLWRVLRVINGTQTSVYITAHDFLTKYRPKAKPCTVQSKQMWVHVMMLTCDFMAINNLEFINTTNSAAYSVMQCIRTNACLLGVRSRRVQFLLATWRIFLQPSFFGFLQCFDTVRWMTGRASDL